MIYRFPPSSIFVQSDSVNCLRYTPVFQGLELVFNGAASFEWNPFVIASI
jgi:hypothetical protein